MTLKFLQLFKKDNFQENLEGLSIAISPSLLIFLNIDLNDPVYVCLAKMNVQVAVEIHSLEKQDIVFSPELEKTLLLPKEIETFLIPYFNNNQILHLGPVIGILTEINDNKEEITFPAIQHLCKELAEELTQIGGFFYLFGLQSFQEDTIHGYFFENNTWTKHLFPYPNVIYNRLHSRKAEASSTFVNLKNRLKEKEVPIFNSRFFSKDETHQLLTKNSSMNVHLPFTQQVTYQGFISMLKNFPLLYIKPVHGSQGRNIIHIETLDHHFIATISSGKKKGKSQLFTDEKKLWRWLEGYTKRRSYICQQGIDFQKWHGRSLDFRILCHKNYLGNWTITSTVARIAQKNAIVANLAQGAEMKPAKVLLNDLLNAEQASQKLEELKALALEIANILSENTDGYLGELGIDIGMDKQGHLWIIEVNSKPSKKLEELIEKTRPSTKALLEYFIALSFSPCLKELTEDE
ncbi:YheC/YheD family protein [Niallia sp.]|uniref:YheC/YheD family endospore coat-associated protein n=1 Tax=Niallia sp. TaxID=2837523 RepID=UPI00289B50EC|nr:YheC/YheD family protein [Niallia sp.]